MKHWHKLMLALAALAACVLVGGVAFAASSGRSRSKALTVRKATHSKVKPSRSRGASRARQARENTPADPDNVQSGDQTAPDTPREGESASESESGADPDRGQSGEPAQGNEDSPGQNVNHECTGDCVE